MKKITLILALLFPIASLAANPTATAPTVANPTDTQSCQASGYVSPDFMTLFCNNGNCTAHVTWPSISANGTCSGGKHFNVNGWISPTTAYGQCVNGFVHMTVPAQMVQFNGTCEQGSLSARFVYTQTQFASGTCRPNGSSMLQLSPSLIRFDGQCSSLK